MPRLCPSGGSWTFRTKAQLAVGFLVQNRFTLSGVFSSGETEEGSAVLRRWLQAWEKEMPRNRKEMGWGLWALGPFLVPVFSVLHAQSQVPPAPEQSSGIPQSWKGAWGDWWGPGVCINVCRICLEKHSRTSGGGFTAY